MASTVGDDPYSDERVLVRQVAEGDREAFLALYDRYAARVYGLVLRMLQEIETAEEVTQDTFVKLWRRADAYDPTLGRFSTWILTIARRTALDRMRWEKRRPQSVPSLDPESAWLRLGTGSSSENDEERWRSLRFALSDLPAEQSQAIQLAYFHGMSHSEIAAGLDLPLGTVKTRIRLGMEKLRKAWFDVEVPQEEI